MTILLVDYRLLYIIL